MSVSLNLQPLGPDNVATRAPSLCGWSIRLTSCDLTNFLMRFACATTRGFLAKKMICRINNWHFLTLYTMRSFFLIQGPTCPKVPILLVVISFRMKLWRVAHFFSLTFGEVCNLKREEGKLPLLFSNHKPHQKWVKKMGNSSEFHSERNYYLQNWYFNWFTYLTMHRFKKLTWEANGLVCLLFTKAS